MIVPVGNEFDGEAVIFAKFSPCTNWHVSYITLTKILLYVEKENFFMRIAFSL